MGAMKNILLLSLAVLLLAGCATGIRPPRGARMVERPMVTTGYCKCGKCCNWRRTIFGRPVIAGGPHKGEHKEVGRTASGTKARPGTIAADTTRYPFGTVMYIPGYGYGRVEDRGGGIQGQHIDLFFKRHRDAMAWGRQRKTVKVWLR